MNVHAIDYGPPRRAFGLRYANEISAGIYVDGAIRAHLSRSGLTGPARLTTLGTPRGVRPYRSGAIRALIYMATPDALRDAERIVRDNLALFPPNERTAS